MSARPSDPLRLAALAHRLSGLGLALFLPLHFLLLGMALKGEAGLASGLTFTDHPLTRLAEGGLVFLLVVHFLGGLRLLVIENFTWREGQKNFAGVAVAIAVAAGLVFIMRAV